MEFYKPFTHYNYEIEGVVLGAFLIDRFCLPSIVHLVEEEMFYNDDNRFILQVMLQMVKKSIPIDLLTLSHELIYKHKKTECNGSATPYYITKLTNQVVSPFHTEYHCFILRQLWAERELLKIQHQTVADGSIDVVMRTEKIIQSLKKINEIKSTEDWTTMYDNVKKLNEHMLSVYDKDIIGVPIGIKRFDLITSGLQTGLHVLAARPGIGKTALLGSAAVYQAQLGFHVGIISLEMPDLQLTGRMASNISDVDYYKIYRNKFTSEKEFSDLQAYLESLKELPIYISDKCNVDVDMIKGKAYKLKRKGKLQILYIDYLQLIESDGEKNTNREQQVARITRGLKLLSKELDIPIVVLAQLSREAEKNKDGPRLSNLRESGAIEQDADTVTFIHSPFHAGEETDEDGNSTEFTRKLNIAKHRNGEMDEILVGYDGPKMKFYDLPNLSSAPPPSSSNSNQFFQSQQFTDAPF